MDEVVQSNTTGQHVCNAFEVLLANQASQSRPGRPSTVNVRTAKDKLFNPILEYLAEQELYWQSDEIDTQGKKMCRKLTDVLWTLDGHHDILSKQSCTVPVSFSRFQGYNTPQKHKHRKRVISNLDGDVIQSHSSSLFDLLHASFWNRSKWQVFQEDVDLLARSLHNYGEYLKRKCSKQKSSNDSIEPVRCFADGISVKVLQSNSKSHPSLVAVEQALEPADMYSYLSLEDFLLENSQWRYAFIRRLEDGLKMPCVLLTYSAGNNKGNFHFVWECAGSEGEIPGYN